MRSKGILRNIARVTIVLFLGLCLSSSWPLGAQETPLIQARQLVKDGSYEAALKVLEGALGQVKGDSQALAEVHYLMAKVYFLVGEDKKSEASLGEAFKNLPGLRFEEEDASFRQKVEQFRIVFSKAAKTAGGEAPKVKSQADKPIPSVTKKKFPWLLVIVGVGVVAAIIYFIVKATKKKPGMMEVVGETTVSISGNQGGPFSPSGTSWTLRNTGETALTYTVDSNASWLSLYIYGDPTLAPGAQSSVGAVLNDNAKALSVGTYTAIINFRNNTNGQGNTTRTIMLSVSAPPASMSVTPNDGFTSSGNPEGPWSPVSKDYFITNSGTTNLNWTATKTQSWLTVSNSGGTLAPSQSVTITAKIDSSAAYSLLVGTYTDTVTFTNTTSGVGNTTRTVTLTVAGDLSLGASADDCGDTTSVTIYFDGAYSGFINYGTSKRWFINVSPGTHEIKYVCSKVPGSCPIYYSSWIKNPMYYISSATGSAGVTITRSDSNIYGSLSGSSGNSTFTINITISRR